MFSSHHRSPDSRRPHATFLLPSFPSLFRKPQASSASSGGLVVASPNTTGVSLPNTDNNDARQNGIENQNSSYRFSVASSSSARTISTVSQTPPSLSTSPSSFGSTTPSPGSLPASPVRAVPLPIVFGTVDYSGHGGLGLPSFATSLSAEPDSAGFGDGDLIMMGSGMPTAKTATAARASIPSPRLFQTSTDDSSLAHPRQLKRVLPTTLRCRRCSADLAFAAQIVSKGFTGRHGRAYLVSAPATHGSHLFAPEVFKSPPKDDKDDNSDNSENNLPNVRVGRSEHRQLVTGAHVVADISCAICHTKLGWKYVDARDPLQRYKVGKFILELARLATYHSWEDEHVEGSTPGSLDYDFREDVGADFHFGNGGSSATVSDPVGAVRRLMTRRVSGRTSSGRTAGGSDEGDRSSVKSSASSQMLFTGVKKTEVDTSPVTIEFDSEDEDECEDIFAGTWDAEVVAKRRAEKQRAAPGGS